MKNSVIGFGLGGAVVNEDSLTAPDEATQAAHGWLNDFVVDQDFLAGIAEALGSLFKAEKVDLRQQWADKNFAELPVIELHPAAEINGAREAFFQETNRIDLSRFVIQNAVTNLQAIAALVPAAAPPKDNLELLPESLGSFLNTLKSAINGQILENLPLLEDISLRPYANELIDSLEQELLNELNKVDNKTAKSVGNAFLKALGPQGLDLLQDSTGDSKLDINDVLLTSNANKIEFKFKLGDDFNASADFADNLGLPNLGFDLDGGVNSKLGLGLTLNFGVDNNGFFVNTSNTNELEVELDANLKDSALRGTFGFLELTATDNGSKLAGRFQADLTGSTNNLSIANPTLALDQADLKLKLNTGVSQALGINNGILPAITSNFNLLGLQTGAPNVQFNNVQLDLGAFVDNFARDTLEGIQKATEPFDPILKILNGKLPVIGSSLIDLAKSSGQVSEGTEEFIRQIGYLSELSELFSNIPTGPISLGSFSFTGTDASKANFQPISKANFQANADAPDVSSIPFFQQLNSNTGGALAFPLVTDPARAVKLLLGQNVDLFTYTTPKLDLGFTVAPPSINIFGPVVIGFEVGGGAAAQLQFGFDTKGLQQFKADGFKSPGQIFDGFYVSKPLDQNGNPIPDADNLELTGLLTAKVGVGVGIAEIAVGGGIVPTFNLNADGKVRGSRIENEGPLCLFKIGGDLSALIFASFTLNFGFFSFSQRLDLADIVLVDFGDTKIPCHDLGAHFPSNKKANPNSEAFQALLKGQGIINRQGKNASETITIQNLGGISRDDDTNTTVNDELQLTGLDPKAQKYQKVRLVVINGGQGNDTIEFKPRDAIQARAQLEGAKGNDILRTGQGDDFLAGGEDFDTIDGGAGNDTAVYASSPSGVVVTLGGTSNSDGFGTSDTLINIENLEGSNYNDQLTGNSQDNVLNSGEGNDTLKGGKGKDVLLAGLGADVIDGGDDEDTTTYIGSRSPVRVNLSSQTASIVNPFDPFNQFTPTPFTTLLAANTGSGGDAEGDKISNVENVQGTSYNDILVASNSGDGHIDGFDGNDLIFAGPRSDKLIAGNGIDWLSYRLSNQGVNANLKGNSFSQGYANADKLKLVNGNGEEVDGNSFENLEGSLASDGELRGEDGSNTIKGLAGNDQIYGEAGNDTLIGGPGADFLDGGNEVDTASYQDSSDFVIANLASLVGSQGDAAGDTFVGVENLFGSVFGDTLTGDAGDNGINPGLLNGQSANLDTADGSLGIDSLTLDYASYDNGKGIQGGVQDIATGSGSVFRATREGSGEERVNFTQIERLLVTGTFQNDQITGGSGDDVLLMGAGNDTVDGGSGSDQLDGDDGIDTLSDDLSSETQDIQLISTDITQENPNANYGSITRFEIFKNIATGSGNDQLTQLDRIDNNFSTNAGNDVVNAGLSFDTVNGGEGDDLLVVDYSAGDDGGTGMNMSINTSSGTAIRYYDNPDGLFQIALDQTDFSNFERYQVTGTSKDDSITTGSGNDTLTGGTSNDKLIAGAGSDLLNGEAGDDVLTGTKDGTPNDIDTLTGGAGADRFLLGDFIEEVNKKPGVLFYDSAGNGDYAVITDFNPDEGDIIQLPKCPAYNILDNNDADGYTLGPYVIDLGSQAIFERSSNDLIAVVQGGTNLNLNAPYFSFVGDPGPVTPPGPR